LRYHSNIGTPTGIQREKKSRAKIETAVALALSTKSDLRYRAYAFKKKHRKKETKSLFSGRIKFYEKTDPPRKKRHMQ